MISKLEIHNYKSLNDLTLEVGRFNVLIGENGCGKSNLLEAIAFAAAAASGKLDNEFLVSRGIRVTEPKLMRSAFDDENLSAPIKINVTFDNTTTSQKCTLIHDNESYSKWSCLEVELLALSLLFSRFNRLVDLEEDDDAIFNRMEGTKQRILEDMTKRFSITEEDTKKYLEYATGVPSHEKLENFLIYSPENSALRNFSKEGQIEPLGINGEGLLKLLKVIKNKSPEQWQEIQDSLELFDWFDGIELPDISSHDDQVSITDRYLTPAIDIDQRSANEGFLFVLFYIALMVSDYTPKIFAIDNIDTSLNPKLCTRLIEELTRLAKKHDKQVFVTTHSPAILDGIDLTDDERLLVFSRNRAGHTRVKRITLENKQASGGEKLKLSEAFLRGSLGGLPKGF